MQLETTFFKVEGIQDTYFSIDLSSTRSSTPDMENLKLILVIGGTGAQGSSVVKGKFSTYTCA